MEQELKKYLIGAIGQLARARRLLNENGLGECAMYEKIETAEAALDYLTETLK